MDKDMGTDTGMDSDIQHEITSFRVITKPRKFA
jgi:hypothetical protein